MQLERDLSFELFLTVFELLHQTILQPCNIAPLPYLPYQREAVAEAPGLNLNFNDTAAELMAKT
jgi:hypothetical protein